MRESRKVESWIKKGQFTHDKKRRIVLETIHSIKCVRQSFIGAGDEDDYLLERREELQKMLEAAKGRGKDRAFVR